VLLLDSSKLDRSALVRFGSVEEIDLLVTDAGIDPERRSELEEIVGEVRVVGTQDTPNTVDPVQAESVS
jgi:DeoR/GlpR family transcriptional regulator of sugar metabolism